jgi:hypothetical protein
MWIKIPRGDLVNLDRFVAVMYRENKNQTGCMDPDGSTLMLCKGDATGIIARAIQRDQKYLEVNDRE